jgi:preprotein translocase subunit SecG
MDTLAATLLMISGIFLILLVLVQRGRGGGLAGAFGGMGGQSAFGTKAGDVFTKITVIVAIVWVLLAGGSILAFRASTGGYNPPEAPPENPAASADPSGTGDDSDVDMPPTFDTGANTNKEDPSGDPKPSADADPTAPADKLEKPADAPDDNKPATDDPPADDDGKAAEKPADAPTTPEQPTEDKPGNEPAPAEKKDAEKPADPPADENNKDK